MDNQNNSNNQNPINPLDPTQAVQDLKPTEEIVNINTQSTQDLPLQEEKNQENESQNMETQGFPQMDSSTPPPPPIPSVEEIPNEEQGTNSPNLDIPSVISTDNKPKKKFGGKTIATILGILMLVGGIGAGVILLNSQQDIRERATEYPNCKLPNGVTAPCQPCTKTGNFIDSKSGATLNCSDPNIATLDTDKNVIACAPGWYLCTVDDPAIYSSACCKVGSGGITPTNPPADTPTNPPLTPTPTGTPFISAQCLNIKAYDTNWNLLTVSNLSNLLKGDKVRFTVAGNATSGVFDKAKFTINTVDQPETTTKKPSSEEFYTEYTIPTGITTFTINAQIHHSTKGWI